MSQYTFHNTPLKKRGSTHALPSTFSIYFLLLIFPQIITMKYFPFASQSLNIQFR